MAEQKNTQDPLNVDEALVTSETFFLKYKNLMLGVVVGLVVVVCAVLGYKNFISEPKAQKASEALFKGQQYFSNDNFEAALNGDSLGYAGFLKIADEFSSTDAGNLANAYAGLCYAQLGKYEEAVKFLDKFSADDYFVAPALMGTMGNCYAQMGQLDKAAATLLKAADKADSPSLSPNYLIQAGQILEKLGKNAEAVNAYRQVKSKYANSYQSMDIDKYIERASK
ncbi:MAG: tetratricopeptide repeat protein [Phocaeicola plebeius]|nr:tetratricopeptide repeat protein [Phocaeicola plebeius]